MIVPFLYERHSRARRIRAHDLSERAGGSRPVQEQYAGLLHVPGVQPRERRGGRVRRAALYEVTSTITHCSIAPRLLANTHVVHCSHMFTFVHVSLNLAPTRAAPSRLTSSKRSKKHGQRKLFALDRIPLLLSLKHSKMRLKVDEAIQAAQDAAQSALHISDIATARCAPEHKQTHTHKHKIIDPVPALFELEDCESNTFTRILNFTFTRVI